MILYLIRHGKTDAHLENRRQSPGTPLGELGLRQAELVAERLQPKKIDHLYSSDWPRALQTAEIIAKKSGLKIEIQAHVHEMKKSPILDNLPDDHEICRRYYAEMRENDGNFDWKFNQEGESLNEVVDRAKKVVNFLEKEHPSGIVAIVTHGTFTTALVSLLLLGSDFDKGSFLRLFKSLRVENAGIGSFEYNPDRKQWRMICFNDHSHLENES